MMTPDRLAALTSVSEGEVQACRVAAPGSPTIFEPRERTVALGFLAKAGLIQVPIPTRGRGRQPVDLTEKGRAWMTSYRQQSAEN